MALRRKVNDTPYFKFYNANPKDRSTGDCVIRAICTATGLSWEQTLRDLTECAIKHSLMTNDTKNYEKYLAELGWVKKPAPRKADNKRYIGSDWCTFCKKQKSSVYPPLQIAHIGGHHIVCIKDYKIHDTWDSSEGSIGNYWIKEN